LNLIIIIVDELADCGVDPTTYSKMSYGATTFGIGEKIQAYRRPEDLLPPAKNRVPLGLLD